MSEQTTKHDHRKPSKPPRIEDEHIGFNGRLAAWMTRRVSSMWVVYFTIAFMAVWMTLGTLRLLPISDPYPFAFLLFMGNVVQLLLVFVILVGQSVLGRAADKRSQQTYDDAEGILHEMEELHRHLVEQDRILNAGVQLVESHPHPWIENRRLTNPPRVQDEHIGFNGKIAAWVTEKVSSMWAFYAAVLFQFGWMSLAIAGVIKFDPYPFAFLLFMSSLLQLIFMFVIMVGQDVLGKSGDKRAQQTYLDAEAVLHECLRLQTHLTAQDTVIVKICTYIHDHVPADHPVRIPHPTQPPTPRTV